MRRSPAALKIEPGSAATAKGFPDKSSPARMVEARIPEDNTRRERSPLFPIGYADVATAAFGTLGPQRCTRSHREGEHDRAY